MITIQKVTSNVQNVHPPVSRHLLTPQTVFSKTVFSIAQSTFRMCSVMAIFKSSIVWGLFEYTGSGAQRLFDHPLYIRVCVCVCVCGPGCSAGIATDYRLDGAGSNPGGDKVYRPLRPALWPTQPPVFPGGKVQPGRAADHSPTF